VVWQFKLQKRVPVYRIFNEEMQYHFAIINATSNSFRESLIDCQFLQTNRQVDGLPPDPDQIDGQRP
jgi:hypothetical protein